MSAISIPRLEVRSRPINIIVWTAVAAVCLLFRLDASQLSADEVWYIRIWSISVLHWLLWQEILLFSWRTPALQASALTGLFLLALFGAATFLFKPEFVNVFLLVATAALLASHPKADASRRLAICFLLIVAAGLVGSSLFAPLHSFWARIDARLLYTTLSLLGEDPVIQGVVVSIPRIGRGLSVEYVCSTTWVVTLPLFTFVQLTILRHGWLNWRDVKALAAMLALIWLVNIGRLVAMSPSQESYEYWHFGTGAEIFSFAAAIVMFLLLRPLEVAEEKNDAA